LRTRVLDSIEAVDPEAWNALAGPASFARHGWLAALEIGGVTAPAKGWTPSHLLLESDDGVPLAACPLWARDDSYGEYVWDEPIASACGRSALGYAPRAVATHPWIPATGRKLLTHRDGDRAALLGALGEALVDLAGERGWASVNVHFCEADEARELGGRGFLDRFTWQYHWQDRDYGSFAGFLGALKASRRQRMKREMRELRDQGITVDYRAGDADDFARMGRLYADTWGRYEGGEPALTPSFFAELGRRAAGDVRFGVASRGDEVVAMTLNAVLGDAMYGRWWGCTESLRYLHFNVAYHCSVEHCLEAGLGRFEPGHGGEFKRIRGFDPVLARSAHWFADRPLHHAIARWAEHESEWVMERIAQKRAEGPFRQELPGP